MSQDDGDGARREPRRSLEDWERSVDRQIREAQERGEFDQLAGAGKPLRLEDDPWAGEWALAYRVVKQAGETLPWIALGKEIEADRQRLKALLDRTAAYLGAQQAQAGSDEERARRLEAERLRAQTHYLAEAAKLDKKLAQYTFMVPTGWLDKGRLPPHIAARRFDAACPLLRDSGAGIREPEAVVREARA